MHILFLTDNFPPETNAPANRTFEHCREWVREGHQVTVLTCAPNFPKGKLFEGYKNRLWQTEEMEGIRVCRMWSFISANEGFVLRILDYLSYMMMAVICAPFIRKVDLVIGTSPQFFTACAAYVVSLYKRIPFVFELRDLWPESVRAVGALGKDSRVLDFFENLELFLYRKADLIISVTDSFKKNLVTRGVLSQKISVIKNGVNASLFFPQEKDERLLDELDIKGKFVAGYIGTLGMAHGLSTLIEVAERLEKSNPGVFHLILLGEGAEKLSLKEKAKEMKLSNISFIDAVPRQEVRRYWSILDVSVIHLRKTELFTTVIPSKLFECMGMGIPVVHGVLGESADIVRDEGVGITAEPENVEEICNAIMRFQGDRDLYVRCRENGVRAAVRYDRRVLAGEMLELLLGVTADGRRWTQMEER
jgi:glycosyltransferase involved in cell wall biosynthesis